MTKRERTMATLGGGIVVVGLGLFGVMWFWNAIASGQQEKKNLQDQIDAADVEIMKVEKSKVRLAQWRRMSLPANLSVARSDYRRELEKLFYDNSMSIDQFPEAQADTKSPVTHPTRAKVPIYTGVNYTVRAKATLGNLVRFLHAFQRMPIMHRIRTMNVERASKNSDLLAVTMNFEAISILDADLVKRKAITPKKEFLLPEEVGSLLKVPMSFGGIAWYLSPQGPYMPTVNPPSQARTYEDISQRNFFIGPTTTKPPPPPPGGTTYNPIGQYGAKAKDTFTNMMRFSRFVTMVGDDEGKSEGQVWDMYYNRPQRVTSAAGLKNFGLVQTPQGAPIVQGTVYKIENNEVIFRISLKAYEGSSSKWYRYPDRKEYYTLHAEDLDPLIKSGKVKANEKANIYLIPQVYWEQDLIKKGAEKVEVSRDDKTFRYFSDPSLRGEVLFSDREVRIVRLSGAPPKKALPPSISMERVYPEPRTIYRVQTKHFNDLLADAKAAAAKAGKKGKKDEADGVSKNDIERVFCVQADFWHFMTHHGIVKPDTRGGTFRFYKDTVCGDILSQDDDGLVVFRLYEQYAYCQPDPDHAVSERWHEGFCVLTLGRFVQDALQEPLPKERLKEFLK